MRMRQSLAQFEAALREHTAEEELRRVRLRQEASVRSRARRAERVHKHGTLRFTALVVAIIVTTVVVTFAMFETLLLLIG
jgi:hypothetical protein